MILGLAGLLGVIVGTAFGGRVSALAELHFRGTWMIIAALLAQVAAFPSGALPWHTGDAVATLLWVGSYALLIAATFRNGHIHGIGFVGLGMACNLVAILANGGHMPALPHAAAATGVHGVHANSAAIADPHLALLVDRWVAPGWVPARERLLGRRRDPVRVRLRRRADRDEAAAAVAARRATGRLGRLPSSPSSRLPGLGYEG